MPNRCEIIEIIEQAQENLRETFSPNYDNKQHMYQRELDGRKTGPWQRKNARKGRKGP